MQEDAIYWSQFPATLQIKMHLLVCETCNVTLVCAAKLLYTWYTNTKTGYKNKKKQPLQIKDSTKKATESLQAGWGGNAEPSDEAVKRRQRKRPGAQIEKRF